MPCVRETSLCPFHCHARHADLGTIESGMTVIRIPGPSPARVRAHGRAGSVRVWAVRPAPPAARWWSPSWAFRFPRWPPSLSRTARRASGTRTTCRITALVPPKADVAVRRTRPGLCGQSACARSVTRAKILPLTRMCNRCKTYNMSTKRDVVLGVRVSREEKRSIRKAARLLKMKTGAYLRMLHEDYVQAEMAESNRREGQSA